MVREVLRSGPQMPPSELYYKELSKDKLGGGGGSVSPMPLGGSVLGLGRCGWLGDVGWHRLGVCMSRMP